jgi:DNA-binding transcriptional LysR family regulator
VASQPWIIGQPAWSFLGPLFDDYMQDGGVPHVVARVHDLSSALGMVRQGWGVSALPRLAVAGQADGVAWQIARPMMFRRMVAITRPGGATVPAVRRLIERLTALSESLPPRSESTDPASDAAVELSEAEQHL